MAIFGLHLVSSPLKRNHAPLVKLGLSGFQEWGHILFLVPIPQGKHRRRQQRLREHVPLVAREYRLLLPPLSKIFVHLDLPQLLYLVIVIQLRFH